MAQESIGIVGLGLVGRALAARLRSHGWHPVGYDIRAEATAAFAQEGGRIAGSLAELGSAVPCVLLAVFDTRGVLEVLEGDQGLLSPAHAVRTVIDCSTGDPELLEPLAARLQAQGIDFVEAPLSGSSQQIEAGEATALVGGSAAAVCACEPLLRAISARHIHVGAAGMGAKAKLATNLVLGLNRAVLAEGFAFAEALGIPAERFLELVLATPARSDAAAVKGPLMVAEDFAPRSRIRQHLKDVDLMLQGAAHARLALPFSEQHARLLREAVAAGEGDLDNAAIVRRLRRRPAA
ncbi:NAD(P)-dependent oxidoreductase [Ramlibacter sp. AN1133]|uniref:NAD(P)-dependent oxidoreductase n=1 Tax=Ramlibacter sp. AN1133 TaxID=3133429 RepID=UPI0030BAFAFB